MIDQELQNTTRRAIRNGKQGQLNWQYNYLTQKDELKTTEDKQDKGNTQTGEPRGEVHKQEEVNSSSSP